MNPKKPINSLTDDELLAELFEGMTEDQIAEYCQKALRNEKGE